MNLFAPTAAVRRASPKRAFSWRGGAAARFLTAIAVAGAVSLLLSPSAQAATDTWVGSTSANWNVVNGFNTVPVPANNDDLVFGTAGAAGTTLNNGLTGLSISSITFNATTSAYTIGGNALTLAGAANITNNSTTIGEAINTVIGGTSGLNFIGVAGNGTTTTLGGANTYTGITTLSTGGRIQAGNNAGLGSSAGASATTLGTNYTVVNTGTGVSMDTKIIAEAFIINGSGVSSNGALRFVNTNTLSSLIQLGSSSLISGSFSTGNVINGNIDLQSFTLSTANTSGTINGVIGGTGGVTIGANSTFILTNVGNSFSGNLTMGSGTVGLGNNGVLGTSTLIFSGGIQSTDSTARTVGNTIGTFTGNATFGQTTTQTGTLSFTSTNASNLNGAARTFTTNVNTSFANPFSGTGGITKAGTATLTLNGTSTYTGGTTVSAGILNTPSLANGGVSSPIGASTNVAANLVLNGGTLQYTGATAQSTDRLFTVAPSSAGPAFSATLDASGSTTAGTVTFTNTGAIAEADLSRTATTTAASTALTGLASTADLKVGAAVTGTNIPAGTTISSITNGTSIVLSQAAAAAGTNALTFGSVDRTLVLTGTNTGTNSIAGVLSDKSATAALSVSKTSTGTWALNGANIYTGTTTVSAGTLALNGAHADGTGALTVTGGTVSTGVNGALGGGAVTLTNGTIQNTLIASGGTTNNVQTSSNLTITSGVATLDFGLGNAGAKFTFTNALPDTFGGILNIINYTGNPFDPATLEAAAGGGLDQLFFAPGVEHQLQQVYFINPSGNTGTFQGRLLASGEVVAPEPSQWLALGLGALGLGGLALKARRRTAQATIVA